VFRGRFKWWKRPPGGLGGGSGILRRMEKIVRKYDSFEEAEAAELERYARMSGLERWQILSEMIRARYPDAYDAPIERCARIYRPTEPE